MKCLKWTLLFSTRDLKIVDAWTLKINEVKPINKQWLSKRHGNIRSASKLANPSERHPVIIEASNNYVSEYSEVLCVLSIYCEKEFIEYRGRGIGTTFLS